MRRLSLPALIQANKAEGEATLRVPTEPAQQKALEALKRQIQADSPGAHIGKWNKSHVLFAEVVVPGIDDYHSYRYRTTLNVFFSGDELMVSTRYGTDGVPISGGAELVRLMGLIRELRLEDRRKEQKREKLRKLKERSIDTQIDLLAVRMRFAYALEPMHTKVKLIVRLDDQNGLVVDIPYNRIQEILGGLEPLITTVRELYRSGARFKVTSTYHIRGYRDPSRV